MSGALDSFHATLDHTPQKLPSFGSITYSFQHVATWLLVSVIPSTRQSTVFTFVLKMMVKPNSKTSVQAVRDKCNLLSTHFFPSYLSLNVTPVFTLPHRSVYVRGRSTSALKNDRKTILYVHGGGFIAGSTDHAKSVVSFLDLTERHHYDVFALDYRLAPDASIRLMVNDIFTAYSVLVDRMEIDPSTSLYLVGDGSGASLVLYFLNEILTRKKFPRSKLPVGVGLFSPLMEIHFRDHHVHSTDVFLSNVTISLMREQLESNDEHSASKYSILNYSEMLTHENMPPVFVSYSDSEPQARDVEQFIDKLDKEKVRQYKASATFSSFQLFHNYVSEGREAMQSMFAMFEREGE